jgi:methyl-accepting chemotaxis protein
MLGQIVLLIHERYVLVSRGLAGQIAVAAREQSHGIEQVNSALDRMGLITRCNVELADRVSRAAAAMQALAGELSRAVGVFQLEEDDEQIVVASGADSCVRSMPTKPRTDWL